MVSRRARRGPVLLDAVLREVPSVLDRVSNADKASLAAARWSVLEAVLRGSDATLKVHPQQPVLHALARRLDGGECRGQIEYRGVCVPATDAGPLLAALQGSAAKDAAHDSIVRWAAYVWRLLQAASRNEEGPLHVTELRVPVLRVMGDVAAGLLLALRSVLQHPLVREHLRHLWVAGLRQDTLGALEGSLRELAVLQGLRLTTVLAPVEARDEGAPLVGLVRECASLRRLELCGAHVEGDAAEELLGWVAGAPDLRQLAFGGCKVKVADEELWSGPRTPFGRLESYEASDNVEWSWVAGRAWWGVAGLRRLKLVADQMDAGKARALADLLRTSTALCEVDVQTEWYPEGATDVDEATSAIPGLLSALAHNTSVRKFRLQVSRCLLSFANFAPLIADVVRRNHTLQELKVTESWSDDEPVEFPDVQLIAEALQDNRGLQVLELPRCKCDGGELEAFGGHIAHNRSLRRLALMGGDASPQSLLAFGRGLSRVTSLRALSFSAYSWGDAQCCALLDGLWSATGKAQLTHLSLSNSNVRKAGAERLAGLLSSKTCTLRELDVSMNRLGDDGAKALAEGLSENKSLVALDVRDNYIQEAGAAALLAALRRNTTLSVLRLEQQQPIDASPATFSAFTPPGRRPCHVDWGAKGLSFPPGCIPPPEMMAAMAAFATQ